MQSLILTDKEILADIEGFKDRILAAQAKLEDLPAGKLPYKEHQKREKARKVYEAEAEHAQRLIEIAEEGLSLGHYEKMALEAQKTAQNGCGCDKTCDNSKR